MKKFLVASVVALAFLVSTDRQASAWHNGGFGFNINMGFSFDIKWSHWCGCYPHCAPAPAPMMAPSFPMPHGGFDLGSHFATPAPIMGNVAPTNGYTMPQGFGQAPSYWYGY